MLGEPSIDLSARLQVEVSDAADSGASHKHDGDRKDQAGRRRCKLPSYFNYIGVRSFILNSAPSLSTHKMSAVRFPIMRSM
jgi:hypothetical protein